MRELDCRDVTLLEQAKGIIDKNYDEANGKHTVGAAVRCKSGKVYLGVNVYAIHGSCAEYIAIGAAITAGEREFDCIVAVRGGAQHEVLPPCGNCRQMLVGYAPSCDVIVETEAGLRKISAKELVPFAYRQS